MNTQELQRHKYRNIIQSACLLLAMALLLGILGWSLAGPLGVIVALVGGALSLYLNSGVAPQAVLRLYKAQPLDEYEAPEIHRLLRVLAQRAELEFLPKLYYVPSKMINAFAVGRDDNTAIGITDGLIRSLTLREIAGVLAHELSHIRNKDTWVMGLADLFSRLTSTLSTVGFFMLLVNLPLIALTEVRVSNWLSIALLLLAPTISTLMQLALARTREYDADLGAVEIGGDPEGLATALAKIAHYQGRFLEQVIMPGKGVPDPSLLRTHPATDERIKRLLALRKPDNPYIAGAPRMPTLQFVPPNLPAPRWRVLGLGVWY